MTNIALAVMFYGQITDQSWITICAAIVTLGTLWINMVRDGCNRKQDRLDRESLAQQTRDLAAQQMALGAQREGRIVEKIKENTEVSKEAFAAANGHNEKIASAVELSKTVIEALVKPPAVQVVHVDNDRESPVPTTDA